MPTTTTTYSFNKPVVGADEDDWGGYLNGNWDSVDDLLDGTTPVTGIDINSGTLDGVTIGGTTAGAGTFTTLTATTSATLQHSASTKLATTSTGVDITGTLTSDGLTSSGTVIIDSSSNTPVLRFDESGAAKFFIGESSAVGGGAGYDLYAGTGDGISLFTNASERLRISSSGQLLSGTTSGSVYYNSVNAYNASAVIKTNVSNEVADLVITNGNNDFGSSVDFARTNSAGNDVRFATISAQPTNNTAGSEAGVIRFYTKGTGDSNVVERMRIDSSGNVGIGTSSPVNVSGVPDLTVAGKFFTSDGTGTNPAHSFTGDQNTGIFRPAADTFAITTGGSERMRIDSSGRVGIGTSSPNSPLEVSNGTENHRVAFGTGEVYLMARNASSYITQEYIANQHVFTGYGDSSSNETMRLDASGNLLVGKTSASSSTAGFQASQDGQTAINRSGTALQVGRLSSDGTIIDFRKDGTTVGSIGTSGNNLAIHGAGTGDDATGLMFVNSGSTQRIVPCQQGFTLNNGIINLGHSTNRFKDLYLSGGVYLGGTGSANKLDDYEEGTWTPASSQCTITANAARYTKVGRMVYLQGYFGISSATSSNLIITGLPFTPATNGWSPAILNCGAANANDTFMVRVNPNNNIDVKKQNDDPVAADEVGSFMTFSVAYPVS